jgi:hypothetical protein
MTPVAFLLIVVVLSVGGGIAVWLRHRQPKSYDSGIRAFQREMDALAPPEERPLRKRGTKR